MSAVGFRNTQYIVINLILFLNILTLNYNMILLDDVVLAKLQVAGVLFEGVKGMKRSFGQNWERRH